MKNKLIIVIGFWLYIFLLGGLLFTTTFSTDVFGKYSWKHFSLIIITLIMSFPYYFFIHYLARSSTHHVNKKVLHINSGHKILLVLGLLVVGLIAVDQTMRLSGAKPERPVYSTDFHPFLQQKNHKNLPESEYHTNSFGFRANEITKEKPKDTYRIVILGGSTAYGIETPFEKTAPKLLEDALREHYKTDIEVINAGVPWYTSQHSIIDFLFRINDFQPDMVIMWHGVNDLYAGCSDGSSPTVPFESDYSHILGSLGNMVNSYFNPPPIAVHLLPLNYITKFVSLHLYTDLAGIFNGALRKQFSESIPEATTSFPSIKSYKRNLRYLIEITRDEKVTLILGNQPNMFRTLKKYNLHHLDFMCYDGKQKADLNSQIKGIEEFNKSTKDISSEYNVPFVDLDSVLPRTPKYFKDAFHWTNEGHENASKLLFDTIVNGDFIPEKTSESQ